MEYYGGSTTKNVMERNDNLASVGVSVLNDIDMGAADAFEFDEFGRRQGDASGSQLEANARKQRGPSGLSRHCRAVL